MQPADFQVNEEYKTVHFLDGGLKFNTVLFDFHEADEMTKAFLKKKNLLKTLRFRANFFDSFFTDGHGDFYIRLSENAVSPFEDSRLCTAAF